MANPAIAFVAEGKLYIVATHVLAYDLCANVTFLYTNGSKIFHVSKSGESTEICGGKLIERVTVLKEQP